MQVRKQGFLDQIVAIYLVVSGAIALGFLGSAFVKGADLLGAPRWAWYFGCCCFLMAINVAYFLGERRHILSISGLGLFPLLLFVLAGALESPSSTYYMTGAFRQDLYTAVWFVALVIGPSMLLLTACSGWYDRLQSSASQGGSKFGPEKQD